MKKENFIIYDPSNSGKTTLKKIVAYMKQLMYSVLIPESGKGKQISVDELDLLKNPANFAYGLVIIV